MEFSLGLQRLRNDCQDLSAISEQLVQIIKPPLFCEIFKDHSPEYHRRQISRLANCRNVTAYARSLSDLHSK